MSTTKSDKHNNNVQSANDLSETKQVSANKMVSDRIKAAYLATAVSLFKEMATKVSDYDFSDEEWEKWYGENAHAIDGDKDLISEVRVFTQPSPDDREKSDSDERKSRVYSYVTRDANGNVDDNLSGVWFTYWVDVCTAAEIQRSFDSWRRFKDDARAGADRIAKRKFNELLKDPAKRDEALAKLMELMK